MAILEVKNINKSFGKTEVLKGVSFSLEEGQVLSIIGSSGSGKTTLLKDLAENLSSGRQVDLKKVSVIDERCELSANAYEYNADLLSSYPKDKAIMCALRTLSPEYIICETC